jgi:hypothetical protein
MQKGSNPNGAQIPPIIATAQKKWKKDATFILVDKTLVSALRKGSLTSNGKIAANNRVKRPGKGILFLSWRHILDFLGGTGTSQTQTIISSHGTFWSSQIIFTQHYLNMTARILSRADDTCGRFRIHMESIGHQIWSTDPLLLILCGACPRGVSPGSRYVLPGTWTTGIREEGQVPRSTAVAPGSGAAAAGLPAAQPLYRSPG